MMALTGFTTPAYASPNAAPTAGGNSSPEYVGGQPPLSGFFTSVISMASAPMGGPCGRGQPLPVPTFRSATRTVPPTRIAAGAEITHRNVGVLP